MTDKVVIVTILNLLTGWIRESQRIRIRQSELIDLWRFVHPDKNEFTWRRLRPTPIFSRLDYFITSENFVQFVNKVTLWPGYNTDHSILCIELHFNPDKHGPGYWKLNTTFLQDIHYVEGMNKLLEMELSQNNEMSKKNKWEMIKMAARASSVQFSTRCKRSNINKIAILERKLHSLELELQSNSGLFNDTETQINKIRHEISKINQQKVRGTMLRSRSRYMAYGEKPTRYFLNLEKKNQKKKALFKLKNDDGSVTYGKDNILNAIQSFYQKLYTTSGRVDVDYLKKLKMPQLSDEMKDKLNQPITQKEIGSAIFAMPNNHTPGTDGLPPEWYKMFYPKIKDFLHELIKEIVQDKKMHLTARRGILSLLEKSEKDPNFLAHRRPLTILNTDNKIYTKILANRMQEVLPSIIDYSQTGFMKGHHLAENVLKIMQIIEECESSRTDGLLISFDFLKAFNTVEWKSMYAAMKRFNFGEDFIDMVKIIFTEPLLAVTNNGFWLEFKEITQGCKQGCFFSPSGFLVVIKTLGIAIRQNESIEGIKLGQEEIKLGQYAGDLWTTLKASPDNLHNVMDELEKF